VKDEIPLLKKKNDKLNLANEKLHGRVISERSLNNNDKATKYCTGLPSYEMLKCIFDLLQLAYQKDSLPGSFEQYIIILLKLRFNLGDQSLAYRFISFFSINGLMFSIKSC